MSTAQNSGSKETILIVDDIPQNLHLLAGILSEQGYRVRLAPDGQLALQFVQSNPPDLILLDILMPDMDGYEVCKELKTSPTTQDIPVIFISALQEVFDKVKAFSLGGVDYITKPFEAQEVLARIENQLRLSRLSKQLMEQNVRLSEEIEERKRVEEQLRESQRWLSAITETNPNAVYIYDLIEQRNVYCNREISAILGYTPEEVQQMGTAFLSNLTHPDDLAAVLEHLKEFDTAKEDDILEFEYRMRHKNGEWRCLASRNKVFATTGSGKPKQFLGAIIDITQRKQAEQALQQQKELLQTIFDHIPAMVDLYDANNQLQVVNREFERVLGWSYSELENIDLLAECYPDPEYRQQVWEHMATATGKWQDFKTRVRDGRYVDTSWAKIRLSNGMRIGIGQDISDRKRAEEALKKSRDFYLTLFEYFPALIWQSGLDAKCNYFNQAWLNFTGRTFEQEIGNGWTQGVHPDDLEQCLSTYMQVFEAHEPFAMEYRLRRSDGEYRWILNIGRPFNDLNNNFAGYVGCCYDISDRKQAEEASILEERNRMAREIHDTLAQAFTGIVIHVGAATGVIATEPDAAQAHLEMVDELARTGLAEARRSVTALRPKLLEEGDLCSAFNRLVTQMKSSADTHLICEVVSTAYPLAPEVESNLLRIGQEALTNAIKYAHASEIRIELVYEREKFLLRVKDNGQGFEVDSISLGGSFGLLGITERAERIGGELTIHSQLGRGTEIVVAVHQE